MASPWIALKGQILLGTEQFVESLRPLIENKGNPKEFPKSQRFVHRPELESIFSAEITEDKGIRNAAISAAYLEFGYSMAAIARQLGIHYSTVSNVISRNNEESAVPPLYKTKP